MIAHQVIEDIDKFLEVANLINPEHQYTFSILTQVKEYIACSHKFLFHTFDSLSSMFEHQADKLAHLRVFLDDVEDCRLPYPDCWFEFEFNDYLKCGVIVHSEDFLSDTFITTAFYKEIGGETNRWFPDPIFMHVRIGQDFDHEPHNIIVNELWAPEVNVDRSTLPGQSINMPIKNFDRDKHFNRNGRLILSFLYMALNIMACLNIGTKVVYPDKRLQKARKKRGKGPLFKYHTLVIKPVGKRQESLAAQGLWTNILHWSKGHKKRYPPPGLFGKYPGVFWWQPIIRGDKKKGFLNKYYDTRRITGKKKK